MEGTQKVNKALNWPWSETAKPPVGFQNTKAFRKTKVLIDTWESLPPPDCSPYVCQTYT